MTVVELIEWLKAFHDQEAIVQVIEHTSGTGYYDQGGNIAVAEFNPVEHVSYTDFRGNSFVKEWDTWYNKRYLFLGSEK